MATTDTYTLNVDATVSDAQRKVDDLVADLEARAVKLEVSAAEPDMSAVDSAVGELEGETVEMAKPVIPAPDVQPVKDSLTDLDTKADASRNVMANLTGNVAGELGEIAGASGPTGVALGQLAEYAADGNISLKGLAGMAGPMLALTAAVEIGTRAWAAYTAKTNETKRVTREVSDALADQDTALAAVTDRLDELVETDAADAFDRLNKALLEGLDEGEVVKVVGALGDLGLTVDDLAPSLAKLEDDTGDVRTGMEELATVAGIPPEYVANIAEAVHAGEDMGEVQNALRQSLADSGMSYDDAAAKADELTSTYDAQIRGLEQLNDAQQNADFDKIAEEQLKLARGADLATAALVNQAESELGPDASALDIWSRYIELQNEAAVAAEEQAAAAEASAKSAEGALAFADAISSVDFQRAELEGAASAMTMYSETMFAAGNQAQDSQVAYNKLGAALTDTALSFDTTTEAGASQQDAMEELAAVIDTDLADAYDAADGSAEDFANRASTIRSDVLAKLVNELGLTADEANAVADALGLADKDVEARFDLAGAEEARLKLGLLSGAMDGLPDDIERSVTLAIAAGDYTTALDEVTEYYEKNEPEIIAEVEADTSQFLDEVGIGKAAAEQNPAVLPVDADVREFEEETEDASADAEAEQTTMPVDADTGEAEGDIDAVQDADHPTTIAADGDTTRAAADLLAETAKFRVANINAQALTLTAKHELDNLTDRRTAQIDANANTAGAENELNHTARTRTSYVNQYVRTYGGYSGSSSSSRAAPAGLTATASSPSVVAPSITINTAVIGDRYDVQRVVARALRGSVRLAGSRS